MQISISVHYTVALEVYKERCGFVMSRPNNHFLIITLTSHMTVNNDYYLSYLEVHKTLYRYKQLIGVKSVVPIVTKYKHLSSIIAESACLISLTH